MPPFGFGFGGVSRSRRGGGVTPPPPPQNSGAAPSMTGYPFAGRTQAVDVGGWTGADAFSYSFKRINLVTGAETVVGANQATYASIVADEFSKLCCDVTATNAGGSTTVRTNASAVILKAIPATLSAQGDSVTRGLNANAGGTDVDPNFAWVKQFADTLGITVVNDGTGSRSLSRMTQTPNTNTVYNAIFDTGRAIGANKRDAVGIFAVGIDAFQGASYNTTANFLAFYRRILSKLLASGYTRRTIIIAGVYPIFDDGLAQQGITRTRWTDFNNAVLTIAQEHGVALLDFYAIPLLAADVSADKIHPTRGGHTKIKDQILLNPAIVKLPNPKEPVANLQLVGSAGQIAASWDEYAGRTNYGLTLIDNTFHQPQGTQTPNTNSATVSVPAGTYHVQVRANFGSGLSSPIAQGQVVVP